MESLKMAISTSSGVPIGICEAFNQRFNLSITQAYGIIEVGLPIVDSLSGDSWVETVGYPIEGMTVAILDDNNQQLDKGEAGYLAIQGAGMFDAYLKPWKTADKIMNDGWFMTGDLAQYQKDGRIIICGREKTMINVSGNKAFPEEIEEVLNEHHDILGSRVFGDIHPLMGEIVCAEVIVKAGVSLDIEAVLKFCRTQLSIYKVPQKLHQVSEIARTQSGKIKRVK
jgi:acyl-coenzyme A synthetase/AMP-(fatty) acid ligase